MSVIRWKEVHYDRGGSDSLNTDFSVDVECTRVFHADTDDNYDDDRIILAYGSCPRLGSRHPNDIALWCNKRDAKQDAGKIHWVVTVGYSNEEFAENPLDEPAKTSWNTENFQEVVEEDTGGDGVVNSAGQYFDPPIMRDDFRLTAVTRKNIANGVPAYMLNYVNSINNAQFVLDGLSCPSKTVKLAGLALSEPQERNDIEYRVLTMTFHIRPDTWTESILDQGMMELNTGGTDRVKITDDTGQPITKPWPLNGSGKSVRNPSPSTAVYLDFEIYYARDFSVLPVV
jgi:hypothetical protein